MGAAWAKDAGFFTPLHHIASLWAAPDAMLVSMPAAGTGSGFHLELGTAALGAVIHLLTGAMYGAVLGVAVSRLRLGATRLTGVGLAYGAVVFLGSAFVGLPVAAALLGSGDQITTMAQMAGWGTFLVEHLLFAWHSACSSRSHSTAWRRSARGSRTDRSRGEPGGELGPPASPASRLRCRPGWHHGGRPGALPEPELPRRPRRGARPRSPGHREEDVDIQRASASDQVWCMAEVDIFCDLEESEMGALARSAPMKAYPVGALIYTPHQPLETLFILKKGRILIFRVSLDGRALTTAIIESGTIFGEMVIVGQQMHDSFAEALDDVVVCVMTKADVRRLLLGDPRISARISETLGRRLGELEQRLSDAVFKSVPERIAGTLVTLATSGAARSLGRGTQVKLTHEQLAALAATSRETTTKVLGEFAERGLISLGRGRITILARDRLHELASVTPR